MNLPRNKFRNHPSNISKDFYNALTNVHPVLPIWNMIKQFPLSMQFSTSAKTNFRFKTKLSKLAKRIYESGTNKVELYELKKLMKGSNLRVKQHDGLIETTIYGFKNKIYQNTTSQQEAVRDHFVKINELATKLKKHEEQLKCRCTIGITCFPRSGYGNIEQYADRLETLYELSKENKNSRFNRPETKYRGLILYELQDGPEISNINMV